MLAAACSSPSLQDSAAGFDASDTPAPDVADIAIDSGPPCRNDSDCADALFCNGAERCMPGAPGADARGCLPANPAHACAANQTCNESMRQCATQCADLDGDGHGATACGGDDCDDADPLRFPGRAEVCDPIDHDEDCDALTYGPRDADGDGETAIACCNVAADGTRHCGSDCNDSSANAHSGLPEACDGLDNDCDGAIDEGVGEPHYLDADHDGFGLATSSPLVQCGVVAGYVTNDTDCNDADPSIHPGAAEPCDSIDNNCSGAIDDGPLLVACHADADADGIVGSAVAMMVSCTCPAGLRVANAPYDCDDGNASVYPGQTAFFEAARSNGTWDYNCNGLDEIGLTRTGSACAGTDPATCMASPSGWNGTTPPGCGQGAIRSVCNYTTTLGCFGGPAYTMQVCH